MPTDPDPDFARAPAALDGLMTGWLHAGGCPCRFPRFRATVERETDALGAPMMTWEQYTLIMLFDGKVPLDPSRHVPGGREGSCSVCGASIRRWGAEVARDQWMEHMRVVPHEGVGDLGASAGGAVPHCFPFFTVGVDDARARRDAEIQYPRLALDAWVAWMQARPSGAPERGP